MRKTALLLALFCCKIFIHAQDTLINRNDQSYKLEIDSLSQFSQNKKIPNEFELPILTALSHFPELTRLHIKFEQKKAYTPLSTSPAFTSMMKRKSRRTYIVTISTKSIDTLSHLLYKNLSFSQQVGIMGHELSHVVDFDNKNFFQSLRNAFGHLSKRFIDQMEYSTDLICIKHGLGHNLKAYSLHVRQIMHVKYWRGVDHVFQKNDHFERYMNPDTIEKYMLELNLH